MQLDEDKKTKTVMMIIRPVCGVQVQGPGPDRIMELLCDACTDLQRRPGGQSAVTKEPSFRLELEAQCVDVVRALVRTGVQMALVPGELLAQEVLEECEGDQSYGSLRWSFGRPDWQRAFKRNLRELRRERSA